MRKQNLHDAVLRRALLVLPVFASLFSCGRKEIPHPRLVVDGDTLAISRVAPPVMDTAMADSLRLVATARIAALDREGVPAGDSAKLSKLAAEFAERASLLLGVDRPARDWMPLLRAAQVMKQRLDEYGDSSVPAYVDSIVARRVSLPGKISLPLVGSRMHLDSAGSDPKLRMGLLCRAVFLIPEDLSGLLCEFISAPGSMSSKEDAGSLIKGLVHDGNRPTQAPVRPIKHAVRDNSALALKHRNQQSIRDSIEKHSVNLQALYRKCLKTHPDMAGTVWVDFTIAASGEVRQAEVKRSDIAEADFKGSLLSYLRTIRFCGIPEGVGDMHFVFPFAFAPE